MNKTLTQENLIETLQWIRNGCGSGWIPGYCGGRHKPAENVIHLLSVGEWVTVKIGETIAKTENGFIKIGE